MTGDNAVESNAGPLRGQSRAAMSIPVSNLSAANVSTANVFGALALELAPGTTAPHTALPQHQAGVLATAMADDLARFAPEAATLECVMVGAHYDAVELLRPGWPIHQALQALAARAPRRDNGRSAQAAAPASASGRIIAFGTHQGRLPETLSPSLEQAGGPLRLLPFVLAGDAAVAARVGALFERDLMERGMAGAECALIAQDAFGLRVEHARYLTVHDLCAMTALQYEHAGLAPLWPLLETALLSPEREAWLDAPPEPLLHYCEREARIAMFSPDAWHNRYRPGDDADSARLAVAFAQFEARQRQFAAVLQAHAVPVLFMHCGSEAAPEL